VRYTEVRRALCVGTSQVPRVRGGRSIGGESAARIGGANMSESHANRRLIEAIRECLGLGPLLGEGARRTDPERFGTIYPERVFAQAKCSRVEKWRRSS
jgi:hypothetical protein